MFLSGKRKEIDEALQKVVSLEQTLKNAEKRGFSVVKVGDIVDILKNGKLTGSKPEMGELWTEEIMVSARFEKAKLYPRFKQVYSFLEQNMPVSDTFNHPMFCYGLSDRQSITADNVIKALFRNDFASSVSEFLDCLLDYTKSGYSLPENMERKLTFNEMILLKNSALLIFSSCEDKAQKQ